MHIITCDILRAPFQNFHLFSFFYRATKTQASCLDDVPVTVERYDFLKESQKPGEEYNAFEQCQQSFGPNFVPHVKPDEPPFEVKKIFFFCYYYFECFNKYFFFVGISTLTDIAWETFQSRCYCLYNDTVFTIRRKVGQESCQTIFTENCTFWYLTIWFSFEFYSKQVF